MLHLGVPIGYRIPLGRASLRGEVLFGGVWVTVAHQTWRDGAKHDVRSATATLGLIETRAAADIWFSQRISFGVYGGVNLLDPRGRAFGLSLTVHGRAFDGDLSIF